MFFGAAARVETVRLTRSDTRAIVGFGWSVTRLRKVRLEHPLASPTAVPETPPHSEYPRHVARLCSRAVYKWVGL